MGGDRRRLRYRGVTEQVRACYLVVYAGALRCPSPACVAVGSRGSYLRTHGEGAFKMSKKKHDDEIRRNDTRSCRHARHSRVVIVRQRFSPPSAPESRENECPRAEYLRFCLCLTENLRDASASSDEFEVMCACGSSV